jgi:exodeoxyribonuclease VII large subunit
LKKHTLLELNDFIKRVVTLNLPETLWVRCEISQINNSRGTWYLDVVEKDESSNQVLAQSQAMLWARDYNSVLDRKGEIIDEILQKGTAILILVKVEFSERYGLKLQIKDINTTYTLGTLELKRRETIEKLMDQGLVGKNKIKELPKVIQRVAIISSETAAGYHDFITQLIQNEYGYHFEYKLFQSAMQGENTERDVVDSLKQIEKEINHFDIAIVIRGGGSKLDLAAFDNYGISRTIANASLPVLTGIGHEIDETIVDLVSHTTLKTPTAVADFILGHNLEYENEVHQLFSYIVGQVNNELQTETLKLQSLQNQLGFQSKSAIRDKQNTLAQFEKSIPKTVQQYFKTENQTLELLSKNIELLSPESALKRGFTMTLKDGIPIKFVSELQKGDIVKTVFKDGEIESIIK